MTTAATTQLRMCMLDFDNYFIKRASEKDFMNETSSAKKNNEIFAKDGDFKYDKAMDYNGDGIVTYDEYMRYCEENAVSQYSQNPSQTIVQTIIDESAQIQSIRPLNIGKALNSYDIAEHSPLESTIESQV